MMRRVITLWLISLAILLPWTTAAEHRSAVAVLDFESIGAEEHLGRAVAEIVRTALVGNRSYRVVERAQIDRALAEQKFQKSGLIDDKRAVEIGRILGADLIIVGSVVRIGNAYTINSRLIDVATGEARVGKHVTGTDLNLLTAMSHELVESFFAPTATTQAQPAKVPREAAGRGPRLSFDNWEVLNGEWHGQSDGSIIGQGGHIILKEEFRDYIFEVSAEHLNGPKSGVGVGIRCTVVPGGQRTFRNKTSINQGYSFNFSFSGNYNIYSGLAGNWFPMNPAWPRYDWIMTDLLDGSVNRIRLEAKGNRITVHVNNRLLVSFTDNGHSLGAPLLWVQENSGERVRFFDLRLNPGT